MGDIDAFVLPRVSGAFFALCCLKAVGLSSAVVDAARSQHCQFWEALK